MKCSLTVMLIMLGINLGVSQWIKPLLRIPGTSLLPIVSGDMIIKPNGNYVVAGYPSFVFSSGNSLTGGEIVMMEYTPSGNLVFYKTIDVSGSFGTHITLEQTSDGGYILAAGEDLYLSPEVDLVVKTNSVGDTTWTRSMPHSGYSKIRDIHEVSGGYLVSNITYLINYDSTGTPLWTKNYPYNIIDAQEDMNGGYMVLKTDSLYRISALDGSITHQFGFPAALDLDLAASVLQDNAGNYIIVGGKKYSPPNTNYGWKILKLSPTGSPLWSKTIPVVATAPSVAHRATLCSDGGYLVMGQDLNEPKKKSTIIKYSSTGTMLWKKNINIKSGNGSFYNDKALGIAYELQDGNYIIASNNYLVKLDSNRNHILSATPDDAIACGTSAAAVPVTTGNNYYVDATGSSVYFYSQFSTSDTFKVYQNGNLVATQNSSPVTIGGLGAYQIVVSNRFGADTSAFFNISAHTVDTAVSQSGNTLMANANLASFQWMNCQTNQIVQGATSSSFTPVSNGTYAVIVTDSICTDTSSCFNLTVSNIAQYNTKENAVSILPNPTDNLFKINVVAPFIAPDKIILYNSLGQSILEKPFSTQIQVSHLPSGIYQLVLYQNKKMIAQKRVVVAH
ncbi:T9SS type A sorting domain-containing protein [Aureispira anguillae]|uniref:T9SS type A sorting domain-containing protein n=1 Tax=Aureispira anguillae TaxID=2864201 RepID=A0A915YE51_9BACT|nr:T9SS type A sorting domain-containing protein [Aureispira anguillae]BDS11389.1 T9SS type A sorting domain-containing protein [Aureispira anguillae]